MNLLIVDDEPDAVKTILNQIHWEHLGLEQVFTASSKAQAIRQIQLEKISILLCDIEMPMGSGLELLEWVKAEGRDICCIFMTCHAEFGYAQRAVQLGSFDYILKPLDFEKLEKVLCSAVRKVLGNEELKQINSYWQDSRKDIIKQFWKDLFVGDIPLDKESIRRSCRQRHLDIAPDARYLPILFCVRRWPDHTVREDQKLFFYALRNIADELFDIAGKNHEVLPFTDDIVLVLLWEDVKWTVDETEMLIQEKCHTFIETAYQFCQADTYGYVGEAEDICNIPEQLELLQMMNYNNVLMSHKVLFLDRCRSFLRNYEQGWKSKWQETWREMIRRGQYDNLRTSFGQVLTDAVESGNMNRSYLNGLCTDLQYLLYEFSRKHNLFLEQLFGDEAARSYAEKAADSYENLLLWVNLVIDRIDAFENKGSDIMNPVEMAKQYIKNHLSEELSMDQIAAYVNLSADYLNRVFKREEGVVLSKFVVQEKMDKAKWLMRNTVMSLGDIAAMVGYFNYSSFNRIFQKEIGMSPQAYKNSADSGGKGIG